LRIRHPEPTGFKAGNADFPVSTRCLHQCGAHQRIAAGRTLRQSFGSAGALAVLSATSCSHSAKFGGI